MDIIIFHPLFTEINLLQGNAAPLMQSNAFLSLGHKNYAFIYSIYGALLIDIRYIYKTKMAFLERGLIRLDVLR